MPKAVPLTPALVEAAQITPQAATAPRTSPPEPPKPKVEHVPLQVRLPPEAVKEIKKRAIDQGQTVSEFMLACFHAHMKSGV